MARFANDPHQVHDRVRARRGARAGGRVARVAVLHRAAFEVRQPGSPRRAAAHESRDRESPRHETRQEPSPEVPRPARDQDPLAHETGGESARSI